MLISPLTLCFPLLTRLHLNDIFADSFCEHLIGLLRDTPNLTELVFKQLRLDRNEYGETPLTTAQYNLALPCLRRLVFNTHGSPSILLNFLKALSHS
jgi:hypothetical protein